MKKVLILIVLFVSTSLFGFDYNSYSEKSINTVIVDFNKYFNEINKNNPKLKISNTINPLTPNNVIKFKSKVKFTGKIQKIRTLKKDNIVAWDRITKTEFAKIYNYEIEIDENNVKYLIPVQDNLLGYFKTEVRKDDIVSIYLILMGNFTADYLIVMTEFQTFEN